MGMGWDGMGMGMGWDGMGMGMGWDGDGSDFTFSLVLTVTFPANTYICVLKLPMQLQTSTVSQRISPCQYEHSPVVIPNIQLTAIKGLENTLPSQALKETTAILPAFATEMHHLLSFWSFQLRNNALLASALDTHVQSPFSLHGKKQKPHT
uniref:Glucosylceramidase-like n=1 Tax=Hypotaenidia okinawae TaxID=2861861 RepID=A0A6G1RVM4_9GRUI